MRTRLEITTANIEQTKGCTRLTYFLDVIGNDGSGPFRKNICNGSGRYVYLMRNRINKGQVPEWAHITKELHATR